MILMCLYAQNEVKQIIVLSSVLLFKIEPLMKKMNLCKFVCLMGNVAYYMPICYADIVSSNLRLYM